MIYPLKIHSHVLIAIQLATFLLFVSSSLESAPRLPSAKRECALCHIMWLTEFKREDIQPLIPYDPKPIEETGRQDVSSTSRMCLSCHDGFVLESRYMWKDNAHSHPVGQKPSEHIKIPMVEGKNLFPLNEDGKVYCGTCHTAHGVDWSTRDSPIFMRVRSRDGKLCEACHQEKTTGPKQGNHPIKEKPVVRPGFLETTRAMLSNDKTVTCQSCHTAHGAETEEKILVTENRDSQLCRNCHEDRHALNKAEAAAKRTHPVNIIPREAKVPESLLAIGARQGSNGQLICETCHSTHDTDTSHGILVKDNHDSQLCHSCHTTEEHVAGGKHDMRLVDRMNMNIREQAVGENGTCSACHLPHNGKGPKMWAREISPDIEPMAAICLSCHKKDGLASRHLVGEYSHPVGFAMGEDGRNIPLPGFSRDGFRFDDASIGSVTCASCHDAHQWSADHMTTTTGSGKDDQENDNINAKDILKLEGDASNSFLRIPNNHDSRLCRTCHKKQLAIANSEHDMTRMAPESVNALQQTPDIAGICGSCHHAHNGLAPRMWARELPADAKPAAANCLSCHNSEGLAKEKLIDDHGHPVAVSVENLGIKATLDEWVFTIPELAGLKAPAPLPLYDSQGHSLSGGQEVGCGTCHDPHRWSPDSTDITVSTDANIEGDASSSFLRITDNGESELCVNCHADKVAIRHSKHGDENLAPNDEHSNNSGSPSGPCSNCHKPHHTRGEYLWSRNKGKGKSVVEKLCTSCHRDGGEAEKKLTGDYNHPTGIQLPDSMKDVSLPLFNADNGRISGHGNIDCATCHDPHQWDPANPNVRSGSDKDVEGDANNSYLRVSAGGNSRLCTHCHSEQQTVLGTDHDMSVSKANAGSNMRKPVGESGVCGQCHSVHHASQEFRLWALDTPSGNNRNESLCLSCHNKNSIAADKTLAESSHPGDITVWSGAIRDILRPGSQHDLPIFDTSGEASTTGIITCPSCHNPHQWQAEKTVAGPGENIEGDSRNSFLRLADTRDFVCADCHGLDSIYRFKYFHSPKARE